MPQPILAPSPNTQRLPPGELAGLLEKLDAGERLTQDEWLAVAEGAPLPVLGERAGRVRRRHQPSAEVGYVIDRNLNYSNVCVANCTFCAFYRKPGHEEGYVLSFDEIYRRVEETIALGGSGVLMQGGLHPDLPLTWYEDLLRQLKSRYDIYLHCFSPPEIWHFHQALGVPLREVLQRLREAGLDSIPGGGAEILVDSFRIKRSDKCTGVEWLQVMEVAHELAIPTTATMMIGHGESNAIRLEHLRMLRELQDRTGGFISFIPWTFQPDNTPLGKVIGERLSDDEYLRWLAISRLFLDNIPNLQVSWLTVGIDAARRGLHMGANDMGSIMIEENVLTPAGATHRATEHMLREAITSEGFTPFLRNGGYRRLPAS